MSYPVVFRRLIHRISNTKFERKTNYHSPSFSCVSSSFIRSASPSSAAVVAGNRFQQIRFFTTTNTREARIRDILEKALQPTSLQVVVESDGCEGGFATVIVESPAFKGKSMLASHRLVNQLLSEEIKGIHGIRVQTSVPPEQSTSSS